jgi:hypothetical protein
MATRYNIYKLSDPQDQVGMPNTHKWAVGIHYDNQSHPGFGFLDAYRTKRAAKDYISSRGACLLCGEVMTKIHPRCACEREAQ